MQSNRKKVIEEPSNKKPPNKQNIISSTAKNLVVFYRENTKDVLQNFSCSTWLKSLSMVLMGSAMAKADEIVLQTQGQETQYRITTPLSPDDRLQPGLCNLVSPTFETLSWENLFSLSDPRNNNLLVQLLRGVGQNVTEAEDCVTDFLQTRYDEYMETVNDNNEVYKMLIGLGSIAFAACVFCLVITTILGGCKKNPDETLKLLNDKSNEMRDAASINNSESKPTGNAHEVSVSVPNFTPRI